jgi:hypothetical protein
MQAGSNVEISQSKIRWQTVHPTGPRHILCYTQLNGQTPSTGYDGSESRVALIVTHQKKLGVRQVPLDPG